MAVRTPSKNIGRGLLFSPFCVSCMSMLTETGPWMLSRKRDPSEGARGVVPRHPELDPLPHEQSRSVVVVRLREGLSTVSIDRSPRALRSAFTSGGAARVGGPCGPPVGKPASLAFVLCDRAALSMQVTDRHAKSRPELRRSISAEAAGRNDGLKFREVEVGRSRATPLRGGAVLQVLRQSVQPGGIPPADKRRANAWCHG